MTRTMRYTALIFLILPLVLFTSTTQAHSIYLSESDDVCENDDNLPKGLSYTEYTPDCEYTEGLTVIRRTVIHKNKFVRSFAHLVHFGGCELDCLANRVRRLITWNNYRIQQGFFSVPLTYNQSEKLYVTCPK